MSTQEFVRNKSPIGKLLFVGAIGTWGIHLMLYLFFRDFFFRYIHTPLYAALVMSYLLLACGATFFYLMMAQPQVAARVWGILGALTPAIGALPEEGIIPFLIAMGGVVLAVKKPKLGGVLILVSALVCWFWAGVLMGLGQLGFPLRPPGVLDLLPLFAAISFLIPGGILALSPQREEPVCRKMALGLIGAFLIAPLLGYFIAALLF